MKMTFYGIVERGEINTSDAIYSGLYDPNGLLEKCTDGKPYFVTVKLFVSKSGKIVALVDKISI